VKKTVSVREDDL